MLAASLESSSMHDANTVGTYLTKCALTYINIKT